MSFWTENSLEPKRSFRFRLGSIEGLELSNTGKSPYWWNAKKVDKPSFSVSSSIDGLITKLMFPALCRGILSLWKS